MFIDDPKYLHILDCLLEYPKGVKKLYNEFGSTMAMVEKEDCTIVRILMAKPYLCREESINFVGRHLSNITKDNKLVHPNWSKWSSKILFLNRPPVKGIVVQSRIDELGFIINELACHIMAKVFGEIAYNVNYEQIVKEIVSSEYGVDEILTEKCISIEFPNCFLSSPAALSLWMSGIRKSLRLCILTDIHNDKTRTGNIIELIKKNAGSFESMIPVIIEVQNSVRDPFFPINKRNSGSSTTLAAFFQMDFFRFMLENEHAREQVFGKGIRSYMPGTGYRTAVHTAYHKNAKIREGFANYLIERGLGEEIKNLRFYGITV